MNFVDILDTWYVRIWACTAAGRASIETAKSESNIPSIIVDDVAWEAC